MLAETRQREILSYLKDNGSATTQELCTFTDSSLSTIRRDLTQLAQRGLLHKTHGGASYMDILEEKPKPAVFSPQPLEYDPALEEKKAIAKAAVRKIHSGDTVFIGAGMTCNLICRYLLETNLSSVHVVSTNVSAVYSLGNDQRFSFLLLGGMVHFGLNHIETLDQYTFQNLTSYYFDKAFFTVDGADVTFGYSIINRAQLPLYDYLLNNSGEVWLLLNKSKIDKRTFADFGPLDKVPNVITNSDIPEAYLQIYQKAGTQLILADKTSSDAN